MRAEGAASATALASFRNPPTSALWGRWDTGGLSGAYQVILTATDRAGNGSLLVIPVTVVDGRLPFLGGVSVSTPLISPNGDGHLDTVSVGFTLARAMTIEVAARNASGATVRLLQSASALPDGEYAISWNGRNGA